MKKRVVNHWVIISMIIASVVIYPIFNVLIKTFSAGDESWLHIKETLLSDYVINSVMIFIPVLLFTILIGVVPAWLVTVFRFPGSRFFNWSLVLPLTIPSYIAAYAYTGIFDLTGTINSFLREITGGSFMIDIMGPFGAIFIFSFILYPYVFLIFKGYLKRESSLLIEASRILGFSYTKTLFRVVLPMALPAIAAGATLVSYEVLSDYGLVQYFGIPVFSTGIFKAWFELGSLVAAIKLSGILLLFVLIIFTFEKFIRRNRHFDSGRSQIKPISVVKLTGIKGALATSICLIPLTAGFLVPLYQLLQWASYSYKETLNSEFFSLALNTVTLAISVALLLVIFSLIIANTKRLFSFKGFSLIASLASAGYAIPGAIIAVAVLDVSRLLDDVTGIYLSGTFFVLIFAYLVRFLTISYGNIEAGYEKIGTGFHEAGLSLGKGATKLFFLVDLPLLKFTIFSSVILAVVDIIKELPLTLVLRPFNFDTLATKTFEYANDEMLQEAAVPALFIILISLTLIFFLNRLQSRSSDELS